MSVDADAPTSAEATETGGPAVRLGGRRVELMLPSWTDPRIHLSIVTISLFVLGIGWLGFRLSIPQILVAMFVSVAIEIPISFRRTSRLVWPASGLQTASAIALLLRATGTENGDLWSFRGWYYFAGLTALGVATKYMIRYRGGHLFNPSNIAIVVGFVVLGSERVEPLDLWWGPLDVPMVLAYGVIIGGGLLISRRLGLIAMGIAFWSTLALGAGVLALLGHSVTAQWSLSPVAGGHFWWIVMTSPEILIYMFFMLTDPKTVPSGRAARLVFAVVVAMVASLLMAPWGTEFGTKVGLLAGLTIVSAARPLLDRVLPAPGSPLDDPRRLLRRLINGTSEPGTRWAPAGVAVAFLAVTTFVAGVAVASVPARVPGEASVPELDNVPAIDPATLPTVSIDDNIYKLDERLAMQDGANELAAALAWNLAVEHEAFRVRDPSLLEGIDHGYRLEQLQRSISELDPNGPVSAPTYRFDSLRLMIAYPGGAQAGANAGLVAIGTVEDVAYSPQGDELSRSEGRFGITFTLRRTTSGNWQVTDTLPVPK